MSALSCYGSPVEYFPDGSRELTREERIEQIGWEIQRETAEALSHLCDAKAHEIDMRAGDTISADQAADAYRSNARCHQTITRLRAELARLRDDDELDRTPLCAVPNPISNDEE